jgi:hypothetical protein
MDNEISNLQMIDLHVPNTIYPYLYLIYKSTSKFKKTIKTLT